MANRHILGQFSNSPCTVLERPFSAGLTRCASPLKDNF
jgi:hypothetical protein